MGEYERLTSEQLHATLASLEAQKEIDPDAIKRALHELQVHQVELEMQNRELRETQQLLEASRNRYAQLYDVSPVGYTTISDAGIVMEINHTAYELLGRPHTALAGQSFVHWVAGADRARFLHHLHECRQGKATVRTELKLDAGSGVIEVELLSVPDPDIAPIRRFLTVLTSIGERKAVEVALRQSHDKLRQLAAHIESLRESERARIAREIHDELGATLTAIKMDLSWCNKAVTSAKLEAATARLRGAMDMADAAIGSIRRICTELRPSVLDNLGLVAALEWQARTVEDRSGIRCDLVSNANDQDLGLSLERSTALFRIVQEALTNVVRHSGAARVRITLRADARGLSIEVQDDGRGFAPKHAIETGSFGLLGMEERARGVGGHVRIVSAPGNGATVSVYLSREL
jgi:PAS domain S-box-containing protein